MIKITSILSMIVLPFFCFAQTVSLSTGFYNQMSRTVTPMQDQVSQNENDSFFHLDVDNIVKIKGIEFGATYSYLITGIMIFVEDDTYGIGGKGTNDLRSHRVGLKFAYPIKFFKLFKFSPYVLTSFETSEEAKFKTTSGFGKINTNKFPEFFITVVNREISQFVPSIGAQMDIRIFRNINLIFNLQYSYGQNVVSGLEASYTYFEDSQIAVIQNTNTGIMMGYGIAVDLDYKHLKESKNE